MTTRTYFRSLRAICCGVLLCLSAFPADRAPQQSGPQPQGVVAAKNQATGQLTPPGKQALQRLNALRRPAFGASLPVVKYRQPNGTHVVLLNEEYMNFAVATRVPGSKAVIHCVTGRKAAQAQLSPKESSHDR